MNNTVRFALVLTIVCAAAAAGVGGIYRLTSGPISRKSAAEEERLRKQVLPEANVFEEIEPGSGVFVCREKPDGPVVGYVAVGTASGYGGELKLMVGLTPDLVIRKVAMLSQHETPGLGADLGKTQSTDTLWDKLAGRQPTPGTSWLDNFDNQPYANLNTASIECRTGVTITGKAIIKAARDAIEQVKRTIEANAPAPETRDE